ncbi:MAG TPA: GNAT family N-acetyltransferase [Frankiaceae bacterium]
MQQLPRPATADDVPALVRLVQSAYRGDASRVGWTTEAGLLSGQRTDSAGVEAALAEGVVLVLDGAPGNGPDDGPLACCQLVAHPGHSYFGMFAVRPGQQGAGVGDALLGYAEQYAQRRFGATVMELTVIGQRAELIAWYVRRGYAETGETRPFPYGDERFGIPLRDDLHFVVLRKPLGVRVS